MPTEPEYQPDYLERNCPQIAAACDLAADCGTELGSSLGPRTIRAKKLAVPSSAASASPAAGIRCVCVGCERDMMMDPCEAFIRLLDCRPIFGVCASCMKELPIGKILLLAVMAGRRNAIECMAEHSTRRRHILTAEIARLTEELADSVTVKEGLAERLDKAHRAAERLKHQSNRLLWWAIGATVAAVCAILLRLSS